MIRKPANTSATKILTDLDIRNSVLNWGGIEYEKKDGQCNRCLMYPIPDHQPGLKEDETFPM